MHSKPETRHSCDTKYILKVLQSQNLRRLKNILARETWRTVTNTQNADQAYIEFNKVLREALDAACPIVQSRPKKRKVHMNQDQERDLTRLEGACITALNKSILTGNEENKKQANDRKKEYDLHLKHIRKKASITYIANAENRTRAVWQIINKNRFNNKTQKTTLKLSM